MSEKNLEEFDQNARIALTNQYASHLRYWGTNILAFAVAFFTAFASRKFLGAYFYLVLFLLAAQSVFALSRVFLFGGLLQRSLCASPLPKGSSKDLNEGEVETYIYLLDKGVVRNSKRNWCNRIPYDLGRPWVWITLTIAIPILIWSCLLSPSTMYVSLPDADWLVAIGTLATAVVAGTAAFLPIIRKRYNRPILVVEFENEKPFCRATDFIPKKQADETIKWIRAYWIRIRIRNKGKSVARKCEGRLERIVDASSGRDRIDFDPVVLHWVGSTHNPIDINKKEYEYLDILWTQEDHPEKFYIYEFDVDVHNPRSNRGIELAPPRIDCTLHITLYGDNVAPVTKIFNFKANPQFDSVQLTEQRDC